MAEWFKCAPLPLLDGLQDLSDDAALVFTKCLLVIYHRDGAIPAEVLRSRFPKWRPHRLRRALDELLATGKLTGTASGYVHNERAMHELAQLQEWSNSLSAAGQKGARAKAQRDRTARRIAERNRSPDMFGAAEVENGQPKVKANEINEGEQARPQHARAPARPPAETGLNAGSTPVQPPLSAVSTGIENGQHEGKPSNLNGVASARPWHARASDAETDEEVSPLCSPTGDNGEVELVEGQLVEDFTIPKRKPGKPIPPDWVPDTEALSENVAALVAQWPPGELEREGVKFIEDAHSNDRRHRNWERAFGVWLTKHDGYLNQRRQRHERPSGWTDS